MKNIPSNRKGFFAQFNINWSDYISSAYNLSVKSLFEIKIVCK